MAQASAVVVTNDNTNAVHIRDDIRLPDFPKKILNSDWSNNRHESFKLNISAYNTRATFSAMCAMHVNTLGTMKAQDCHSEALKAWTKLVTAFKRKYPDATVGKYLGFTSLNKITPMDGEKIWRMACQTRPEINNVFNPVWLSCLSNGKLPSGKDWEWVRKRTLILLYRRATKDETPLAPNEGKCA